ncbi:DNA alkylation repair protein [Pseudolysobacter antarcticus]|uniref:DNA alkylation repair protein n=1 Tax=Pseudolysobacter antarcticus TaxID=2511995 RepID=A0A411HL40_9GAMM|nr:DNA alkylation repair protein [Pseudolysobacter antarcticus]QBB71235.1 DNA alkylation repair protein [Pseudolysobacter antarcticus]
MPAEEISVDNSAPKLKEIFDAACFRRIAKEVAVLHPRFDAKHFLALALDDLDALSLMQRMRRMSQSLHATLPQNYPRAIAILRKLAPRIHSGFVTLVLSDFVGVFGHDDFDLSMQALAFFTTFGSAEFAIREFLRRDPLRTLAVMEIWSRDADEHLRRLASEGSRPRLPWSFRLDALIADPNLAAPILENLKTDTSLYVRKSVANHLNDIAKDHPDWVLDRIESWSLENRHTAWIAKHALRTLIKKGDRRALSVIGAGAKAQVLVKEFSLHPRKIALGEKLALTLTLESTASKSQRLVVDYAVHYVKKSGSASAKIFKWKELTLDAHESLQLTRSQTVRDFTTRVHYAGRHEVEILINGEKLAKDFFDLSR